MPVCATLSWREGNAELYSSAENILGGDGMEFPKCCVNNKGNISFHVNRKRDWVRSILREVFAW